MSASSGAQGNPAAFKWPALGGRRDLRTRALLRESRALEIALIEARDALLVG
jgi:hypothetical protein